MRLAVYTVVFGDYDRIFPPVKPIRNARCFAITDNSSLDVDGWTTYAVPDDRFDDPREANRYFKMVGHRDLGDFDASIYVDGNVRLLGDPLDAIGPFMRSGAALGLYRHHRRSSVKEEIDACIAKGKVAESGRIRQEYEDYVADGFPDDGGLVEATILMKNHRHPALDDTMALWYSLFRTHKTRDQISLPYVLWKTGTPCYFHPSSFRDKNPHFGIYPHFGDGRTPLRYAYHQARAFDSALHRAIVFAWHRKWAIQRRLRRSLRDDP